jgi:uncharacterized membrane protein
MKIRIRSGAPHLEHHTWSRIESFGDGEGHAMSLSHVQEHIELIARHEMEFLSRRTPTERFADNIAAFIGSLRFIAVNLVIFATWILLNTVMPVHHIDPKPFSLLQACVAMEGIFVASFILIRQGRLGRRSDERDHLMLQILLLTEKEITAVLSMDRKIAEEMGLGREANRQEIEELSQDTPIDEVAQTIKENLGDNTP